MDSSRRIVLVAHGSRDPRSAEAMRGLAADAGAVAAFLDFDGPTVPTALRAAGPGAIVVPALLTRAYHGKVDVPKALADAGVPAHLTAVLGPGAPGEEPHPLLLAALRRRLSDVEIHPWDGVVLIAAGTTDTAARSTVEHVAARLGRSLNVVCAAGYASGNGSTPGDAISALRDAGARRISVASYFLAPGRLYDAVARQAVAAGAIAVAAPLAGTRELVELVRVRAAATAAEIDLGLTGMSGSPLTPVSPRSA